MNFNELPMGTVFYNPIYPDLCFIKFAQAAPGVAPHNLPPNCLNLENNHYCTIGAKAKVIVMKQPADFDDTVYDKGR